MKKIIAKILLILLLTIFSITENFAQSDFKINKSDNSRLIKVLNNMEFITQTETNYISVKIYKVDNGSGSAGSESCEVSFNLLFAISEFDENPNQNLFEIGPLINPKFLKWIEKTELEKELEIEFGEFDNKKKIKLSININDLSITD